MRIVASQGELFKRKYVEPLKLCLKQTSHEFLSLKFLLWVTINEVKTTPTAIKESYPIREAAKVKKISCDSIIELFIKSVVKIRFSKILKLDQTKAVHLQLSFYGALILKDLVSTKFL